MKVSVGHYYCPDCENLEEFNCCHICDTAYHVCCHCQCCSTLINFKENKGEYTSYYICEDCGADIDYKNDEKLIEFIKMLGWKKKNVIEVLNTFFNAENSNKRINSRIEELEEKVEEIQDDINILKSKLKKISSFSKSSEIFNK